MAGQPFSNGNVLLVAIGNIISKLDVLYSSKLVEKL